MLKLHHLLFVFVIGLAIGVLICSVFTISQVPIYADATSGEASGLIAATGLCANGISGLWVLDARDTKTSPSLCLYLPESGGRTGFRLTGARRIKYDLQLLQYQDRTPGADMTPSVLQRKIEEINKKEEDKAAKRD